MSLEVNAIYENGVLRPDKPLPLEERERVTVRIEKNTAGIRQSSGCLVWRGSEEELAELLGPDNGPWDRS